MLKRWCHVDKRRFTIVTSPVCAGEVVVLRYSLGQVKGEESEAEESATYKVGEEGHEACPKR